MLFMLHFCPLGFNDGKQGCSHPQDLSELQQSGPGLPLSLLRVRRENSDEGHLLQTDDHGDSYSPLTIWLQESGMGGRSRQVG